MKVIRLEAENVKRLRAVEITPDPDGNLVIVAGKNSQGKTSVLDSIIYALGGAASIPEKPIRSGEEAAFVILETETYVITRNWTADDRSYLTVKPKDVDAKLSSPQKILDALVGDLAFDPLDFSRRSPAEQRQLLVALAALDVDALDDEIRNAVEIRRDANAELKAANARLEGLVKPDIEEAEVEDPAALTAQLEEMLEKNEARRRKAASVEQSKNLCTAIDNDLFKLEERIKKLQEEAKNTKQALDNEKAAYEKSVAEYEAMPEKIDTAPMREKIAGLEAANEKARGLLRWQAAEEEVHVKDAAAAAANAAVTEARAAKTKAIEEADLPIADLGIDDNGITFGGIPFQQLGSAEQLRISMAMAMTLNPELRVIIIKDGSLLDSDSMAIMQEMAHEKDYQIWVEVVDESGDVGVVIEDGRVRGAAVKSESTADEE